MFSDRFPGKIGPDTNNRDIVKILPGEGAELWPLCLEGDFVCVGWSEVGDLREFNDKAEFKERFYELFSEGYNSHGPTISRKANELWRLRTLSPGDVIVANRGMSHVLGIGLVQNPPYEFRSSDDREGYSHLVNVKWDTSYAKDIPKQGFWAMTTVADVPTDLYEFILGKDIPTPDPPETKDYAEPTLTEIGSRIRRHGLKISDRFLRRYHMSLKTRGFVVLCGLSGSGKTWLAELYAEAVGAKKD